MDGLTHVLFDFFGTLVAYSESRVDQGFPQSHHHHADLVNSHLQAMRVAPCFAAVVTSVEHGKRKPSRSIFECALERSGGEAPGAVYVGDSYSADYLGAVGAGVRCLLIDPERQHDVPPSARLTSVVDARRHLLT